MNKLFKGAIASAAGVALLLGGAGTFALWQDTAGLRSDATIEAGRLEFGIDSMPAAVWTINGEPIAESAIEDVRFVPGDVVTMTWNSVPVIVDGDYLVAKFGVSLDNLHLEAIDNEAQREAAEAFFADLTHQVKIREVGSDTWHASTDEFDLVRGPNLFEVRAEVTFDPSAMDQVAYGAVIPLAGLGLSVEQVPHVLHANYVAPPEDPQDPQDP